MNSLEDAFVNIGMDESKFLKRAKRSLGGQASFINDEPEENFVAPDCLKRRILSSYLKIYKLLIIALLRNF